MTRPPRSALRVALLTFLVVLVGGFIVSLAIVIASGNVDDRPERRGEQVGQGLATLAALAGAVAYLIQHRRRQGK